MSAVTASIPGTRRVEHIMGMPILLDVRDEHVDEDAVDEMFRWLQWVDETFSTYKDDSQISRIGRGELAVADAHEDVRFVLDRCEELCAETAGFFDMYAGGSLDPSGLVKGWSVGRASDFLQDAGLRNFALSAGGDMRLSGRAVPELQWHVGIQHPLERDRIATSLALTDIAVATSGAYARGEHVIDPHTGRPPADVLSVTVIGADLGTADAYATAAFAMGAEGPAWTARLHGYEAMTILSNETVLTTGGFPDD